MGYRSDIHIRLRVKRDLLDAFIALAILDGHKETLTKDFNFFVSQDEVDIVCDETDVKWYSGYHDVDRIESFFAWATQQYEDNGFQVTGIKLRIGEDNADVDEIEFGGGDLYECVQLQRTIYVDYSGSKIPHPFTQEQDK